MLCQDVLDDLAVNVGQAHVATAETHCQTLMIDAEDDLKRFLTPFSSFSVGVMLNRLFFQQIQQLVQKLLTDTQNIILTEALMFKQWDEVILFGDGLLNQLIPLSVLSEDKRPKTIRIIT
jgi:hypothetical protein